MTRKVEVERFTLTSSRPFDEVVAVINDAIGHPDMTEFWRSTHRTQSAAELESTIRKALGKAGLMLFVEFDHGAIVRKGTGRETPRMVRLVMGNPLIMKEMVKHVPDAGSYAPVTILIDERPDGVHLSYDRMASFLAPYANPDALEFAQKSGHESRRSIATSSRLSERERSTSAPASFAAAMPKRQGGRWADPIRRLVARKWL